MPQQCAAVIYDLIEIDVLHRSLARVSPAFDRIDQLADPGGRHADFESELPGMDQARQTLQFLLVDGPG